MTSLASQLASIARSSTHALDLKAQKAAHSQSLLFEPRIAGTQSFHALYQLCFEGFRELCLLDSRFLPFGKSIFGEQSVTEERQHMTAEENAKLDTVLERFLELVGSRLLLKPATKAVEWLIRRFRIHEYNTGCLILTFLPYYSTSIFATLLSILPKQLDPTYRFLHPYMTSLANPPRQSIVYAAVHTPSFFSTLNAYILKTVRAGSQYPGLLSFWAGVATQAVDGQLDAAASGREAIRRQREEDVLLKVLPTISEALSFKEVPELIIGCCMIMTVLATKADLEDKTLDGMMEALTTAWDSNTVMDCLVCMAVIAQERQSYQLNKEVARSLLKLEGFDSKLLELSTKCRVERLATGCLLYALRQVGKPERVQVVENIMFGSLLDEGALSVAIKSILEKASSSSPPQEPAEQENTAALFKKLNENPTTGTVLRNLLQESGVDIEAIEMQLSTVVLNTTQTEVGSDEDQPMEDIDAIAGETGYKDILSQLPEEVDQLSLLVEDADTIYADLARAFLATFSAGTSTALSEFTSLTIFKTEDGKIRLLTFLMRFWCSSQPAMARAAALELLHQFLQKPNQEDVKFDHQSFIPCLIYALSDPSPTVRKVACQCVSSLSNTTQKYIEERGEASETDIFASQSLYGKESNIKWLRTSESSKFLSTVLVPNLKQLALDSDQLSNIIKITLGSEKSAGSDGDRKEKDSLKSSAKVNLVGYLSSHAARIPLLRVRIRLFDLLNPIGKNGTAARAEYLLPALKTWLGSSAEDSTNKCKAEGLDLPTINKTYFNTINSRESEGLDILLQVIKGTIGTEREDAQTAAFDRIVALWPKLKSNNNQEAALTLLDLALSPPHDASTRTRTEKSLITLRSVELNGDILVSFLDSLPSIGSTRQSTLGRSSKRIKTKRESGRVDVQSDGEIEGILRKYTLILELVEASSPENYPALLKGLFNALGELHELKVRTESELVYVQGLALSSILSIVQVPRKDLWTDKNAIRADILVESIRTTTSAQVRNTALLVVSALASGVPESILHAVMPIFTFISTSTLRATDEYSAHVIDETISHVIPPLASSLRKRNSSVVQGASEMLLSFVTAFEHIPLNRRSDLFVRLVSSVGVDDCLYAVLAMLLDNHTASKRVRSFSEGLITAFDARAQLFAVKQYLNLVADALRPRRTLSNSLLNWNHKTPEEQESSLINLLDALAGLLAYQGFKDKLAASFSSDTSSDEAKALFSQVLQGSIRLTIELRGKPGSPAAERVLGSALRALPIPDLVKSTESLLDEHDDEVRRIVVRSLMLQVSRMKEFGTASGHALLGFMPRIMTVIQTSTDTPLKLTAISCIDKISEKFGKLDKSAILGAAQIVAGTASLRDDDREIQTMSLLALTSMVEVLKEEFIPLIPQILKKCFELLGEAIAAPNEAWAEKLHNAAFQFLNAVAENISYIISGKDLDSALKLSLQSAVAGLDEDAGEHRRWFGNLIAKTIDSGATFTSLGRILEHAMKTGPKVSHPCRQIAAGYF